MEQQKHLSEVTFQEAVEYRSKCQRELERLQHEIIYWSGICDFLKDKNFIESQQQSHNN